MPIGVIHPCRSVDPLGYVVDIAAVGVLVDLRILDGPPVRRAQRSPFLFSQLAWTDYKVIRRRDEPETVAPLRETLVVFQPGQLDPSAPLVFPAFLIFWTIGNFFGVDKVS